MRAGHEVASTPQPIVMMRVGGIGHLLCELLRVLALHRDAEFLMTSTASGFIHVPASVPAECPRTGSPRSAASLFVKASAICERPALWTQT